MHAITRQLFPDLVLICLAGLILSLRLSISRPLEAAAAPALQLTEFPTPTPGPGGRILYAVQEGDTLWRIAAISGLTLEELRGRNNLSSDDVIVPGQILLLDLVVGPAQAATQVPGPATPILENGTPLPTPGLETGNICVLLFDDINGDALRQEEETAIPGGAISISNRVGAVSRTSETEIGEEPGDPTCLDAIPDGVYNISVAIPDGYNPTTILDYTLNLQAGDEAFIDFGAQLSTEAIEAAPSPEERDRSPILGIIGALLLLSGIGLGIFAGYMGRRTVVKRSVE